MNCNALRYSLGLLIFVTACSPKAVPSVSKTGSTNRATTTANYNGYNDDLTGVRPSYVVTASSATAPAGKVEPVVTPTRKATAAVEPAKRNDPPVEALHVNKKLDALLDTIAQKNRSVRYASGYRIQIYVGNERQEADAAKLQVYQSFPELSPYLSYKQPTYRLKVGDFMRRLDAEWYLSQLKQQFTSVILKPDKVDIRRSLFIK